jgi:hypothetical protein
MKDGVLKKSPEKTNCSTFLYGATEDKSNYVVRTNSGFFFSFRPIFLIGVLRT